MSTNVNLLSRIATCLEDHGKRLNEENQRDPVILQTQLIVDILLEMATEIANIKKNMLK